MVPVESSRPIVPRGEAADANRAGSSRRAYWIGLAVVYVVVLALFEAKLSRPGTLFGPRNNVQIAEAAAWWQGRLTLPERLWDTAVKDGEVYSHFPVMFSILAAGLVPLFHGVPHWFIVLLVLVPVPWLGYGLMNRLTGSSRWGAALTIGLICGTSAWPVLNKAVVGCSQYHVNHTLATIGLLILLNEFYGQRRVWVGGAGLIVATLARQLTVAFAIPLAWMALRGADPNERRKRLISLAVVGLVVVAVPCIMNTLKFGHPLDTGYMRIYGGREEDSFARDAGQYGLFSTHFLPRNLYYMNVGLPDLFRIEIAGRTEVHLRPNTNGTGIWWTTPLLLWLVIDIRRILRDPAPRSLLVACVLVYAGLMLFHATGSQQRGYNRFSLDFMPVLLAILAPTCFSGRRRWLTLVMLGWSVFYFRWFIQPGTWQVSL